MPVSVQHILDPRGVLATAERVESEDALYDPALSYEANAFVRDRDFLRVRFNFRALAYYLRELNLRGAFPQPHNDFRVTLKADHLADVTTHAYKDVREAAGQAGRDLRRMEADGLDSA